MLLKWAGIRFHVDHVGSSSGPYRPAVSSGPCLAPGRSAQQRLHCRPAYTRSPRFAERPARRCQRLLPLRNPTGERSGLVNVRVPAACRAERSIRRPPRMEALLPKKTRQSKRTVALFPDTSPDPCTPFPSLRFLNIRTRDKKTNEPRSARARFDVLVAHVRTSPSIRLRNECSRAFQLGHAAPHCQDTAKKTRSQPDSGTVSGTPRNPRKTQTVPGWLSPNIAQTSRTRSVKTVAECRPERPWPVP